MLAVNGYLGGILGSTPFDRFLRVAVLFGVGPAAYVALCLLFRVREVTDLGKAAWGKVSGYAPSP